jgi:hypothetical protein
MRKALLVLVGVIVATGLAVGGTLLSRGKDNEPKELTLIYTHNVIGQISATG